MCFCEVWKEDINIKAKSSHNKSDSHKQKEITSGINNNLINKSDTNFNPKFDQVGGLVEKNYQLSYKRFP